MSTYVYWYHLPEDSDPYTTGYIGVTNNLTRRHKEHARRSQLEEQEAQTYGCQHFYRAIKKAGSIGCLVKDILAICDSREEALTVERDYRPKECLAWNIAVGGGHCPDWTGRKHLPKSIEKMKASNTGRTSPLKGLTGRWTEEQRLAISKQHKGKTVSQAQIAVVRAKNRANHPSCCPITLVHKNDPSKEYTFHSISQASRELDLPLSRLKSKVQSPLGSYGRDGWKVTKYKSKLSKV